MVRGGLALVVLVAGVAVVAFAGEPPAAASPPAPVLRMPPALSVLEGLESTRPDEVRSAVARLAQHLAARGPEAEAFRASLAQECLRRTEARESLVAVLREEARTASVEQRALLRRVATADSRLWPRLRDAFEPGAGTGEARPDPSARAGGGEAADGARAARDLLAPGREEVRRGLSSLLDCSRGGAATPAFLDGAERALLDRAAARESLLDALVARARFAPEPERSWARRMVARAGFEAENRLAFEEATSPPRQSVRYFDVKDLRASGHPPQELVALAQEAAGAGAAVELRGNVILIVRAPPESLEAVTETLDGLRTGGLRTGR